MKLIYKGKFNGDVTTLPHGEHKPGATKFKEFEDTKKFGIAANIAAFIILILLIVLLNVCLGFHRFSIWACVLPMLTLFPHEILHAVCFKHEVYLYTNFKQGMLFVVGPEDMSKAHFIFMSLLPSIVFGFIPYIVAFTNPSFYSLGYFGALCICMGAGDFYNVFNALTQMPKGAHTYLYGFNSYWYMPKGE